MEGRDFAPPPHVLAERSPLLHRAAARSAPQHPGHFQPGKYYPPHLPVPPHSGTGLMGNSSASFMGTFLASSLGSPPSHPSGPTSSPSSPPYRNGPHSSAPSQLWFPHPHEAPGYSRFSGSLAPTFLPMSPLDHHGNSSVLYGQHRFYDTSKDFYIRSLSSQPHLLPTNHSLPPLTRTAPSHPLGSCSRERDPGAGGASQKSSKEPDVAERGLSAGGKEKERSKHEAKERQHHDPPSPAPHQHQHQHLHSHHHPQLHPFGSEEDPRHKEDPKHLSACLLTTKTHNGSEPGTVARGSLPSCVGPGASILGTSRQRSGANLCCKERVSGEMRISEPSSDCLRHSAMLGHTHPVPYSIPPPLGLGSAVGGSWLHPTHPHHHHTHHPHPDLYCPPPPAPITMSSSQDKGLAPGVGRDPKVTGPTFVPSVGPLGDQASGPFHLGNSHCRGARGVMVGEGKGEGVGKAKDIEKMSNGGRIAPPPAPPLPPPSTCQRKPSHQQQLHVYGKADKGPDWSLGPHNPHIPQQAQHSHNHQPHSNLPSRSCSLEATENSTETDAYRPSLPQGAKDGCQGKSSPYASTPPFRDYSHSGPLHRVPSESKTGGESGCALQRDSQRVARIQHQQHSNRLGTNGQDPELSSGSGSQDKKKMEAEMVAQGHSGHQAGTLSTWEVRGQHALPDNERRKACDSSAQGKSGDHGPHPPFPAYQEASLGPQGPENSAMKNLMKYSSQQPLLLSQKSPFGGLGSLKQGTANGDMRNERNGGSTSCAQQEGKQTLPSRRASSSSGENERSERVGKDSGEVQREGEVRQPPVGIAMAVARQREPLCRPPDGHATHSRHGRVLPSMKEVGRAMHPLQQEEERKRIREEQLALPPLDREILLRENKDRVEFARIHPSSSCHGDLTSHLIVPGSSQLGADPSAHTHPAHHHWMPRTGSPSLWMGHSYGLSHAALHQNLPPGFSAAMPSPLQPVLSLPQDPSAALVVLPTEPAAHPATHHLDVMEQQGLWPPVYGPRGPASHMQHPSVYSRQFLRQQELYVLQQHQHQQHHRAAQAMELAHRSAHSQMKPEDTPIDLDEDSPEPRTPKPAKPFSFTPSSKPPRSSSSPGGCASRLSPCCHSPAPRPHPKSTPCTPCPEPSPAVAAPRSPALSPHSTPHHLPKAAESQDKRGEGQPPQDYPQSLEPDLPPGYTYPAIAIGYKAGPSPQEVQLAEHADLEAEQAEPAEPAPHSLTLSTMGVEPACPTVKSPTMTAQVESHVEKVQSGTMVTKVEDEVDERHTCTPVSPCPASCQHPTRSPCPVTEPPVEESQADTASVLSHDHVSVIEPQGPAEEVKIQGEGMSPWDSTTTSQDLQTMEFTDDQDRTAEEGCASPTDSVELQEVTQFSLPSSPCPELSSLGNQYPGTCIWSLELLIAAALCATRDAQMASSVMVHAPVVPLHHGMELLSELADLERRQQERSTGKESEGEERLAFDLESLATLAAARALELTPPTTDLAPPLRQKLNLRKKCKWTPRHEPVCPVKGILETLDREELAMRVRLADLQRRYKEKQKELAKLQRKHDHQKEDTSRSPARRGPGRPRKRKPTPGPPAPTDTIKRVKSAGAGPGLLAADEELTGGGDKHRKRKKMTNSAYHHISTTQVPCRQRGRPRLLSSKMAQLKQKAKAKRGSRVESMLCHREKAASGPSAENTHSAKSGGQSDTGSTEAGVSQSLEGQRIMMRRGRKAKISLASSHLQPRAQQTLPNEALTSSMQETTAKDISTLDSEVSELEEEDDGVYDSEEVPEDIKNLSSKEQLSGVGGPSSSSSTVELEAGPKVKSKKKRQGLGCVNVRLAKGEVKNRRKAPFRPNLVSADRNQLQVEKRPSGLRWREGSQENSIYPNRVLKSIPNQLERTTRKGAIILGKRRNSWLETVPSQGDDIIWNRKIKNQQAKGRAMSQLLESFTADEGFRMEDDSSFSEGEEEEEEEEGRQSRNTVPALPNCVLTKEALRDGLKVLISKEDELLYAAYVHTLDLPDIYSIVIEGERGNRPRIYSLEQLLQEAVLDVRLETVETLTDGTRVCAYWSERSRCLYPGYVRRGGPGEEQKEGCLMVEFDDGDRGWITLPNIRLLPPGYQIYCAEPSPALLTSPTRRRRKSSTQEKSSQQSVASSEWHGNTEPGKGINMAKPGRPKSVSLSTKKCLSENVTGNASSLLTWPAVAMSKKKPSLDLFQFNGLSRKTLKEKETDVFGPLAGSTTATPAKGIFSTSFEVDSFSSIANGFTSFGNQQPSSGLPLGHKSTSGIRGRRTGDRREYLVKLDHEGVTSPKTKNGKALMLLGNSEFESRAGRIEKVSGKGMGDLTSHMDYSQPMLLVKDAKRSSSHLLKGSSSVRKQSQGLGIGEYADYGLNCHSDCLSSYSDMDEDEEEEDARRAAMRNTGRFLSRLSVSSSSSGSSSSSSSGSLSSSSVCSSDNDSSYSSDEEEASRLLLQGCLSSRHTALQQQQHPESPTAPTRHAFSAKTMAVNSPKSVVNGTSKHQRRKDVPSNSLSTAQSKSSKDFSKKQKMSSSDRPPNSSSFLPARQLWRWSGNPTQRRGLKGKARKLFYKAIVRGKDTIRVGDCAVFLSSGRPHLPYIGRIESLWESWASNMVVKVKWFYHPEETKLGKRHRDGKHALYQSCHEDENDVQTISHKCQVVSRAEYERLSHMRKPSNHSQDLYYLAGTYDPTTGQLVTAEGVSIIC
ncbi:hypothetical protein NFI96_019314 [Prochilodus magdalenae]|nr:hypothetical protein NFI96_019314 [Prochilodus magdalenae]